MLVISSWETWTTWQAQLLYLWNWLVSSSLQVRKCHCFSHGRLSMFPFTSFDCCGTDLGPTIIGNEQAWRPENAADWQFLLLACHFVGPWCNLCKMKKMKFEAKWCKHVACWVKVLQSPHLDMLECSELSGPGDGSLLVPPAGEAASRFGSQLESFKQEHIQDYSRVASS